MFFWLAVIGLGLFFFRIIMWIYFFVVGHLLQGLAKIWMAISGRSKDETMEVSFVIGGIIGGGAVVIYLVSNPHLVTVSGIPGMLVWLFTIGMSAFSGAMLLCLTYAFTPEL